MMSTYVQCILLYILFYDLVTSEDSSDATTGQKVLKLNESNTESYTNFPTGDYTLDPLSDSDDNVTNFNKNVSFFNDNVTNELLRDIDRQMNETYDEKNHTIVEILDWKEEQVQRVKSGRRLTGSRYTFIGDYPYVASVQKNNEHWCTGTILSDRIILSSADCMLNIHKINGPILNDRDITVRMGSSNPLYGGVLAGVLEIARHPDWGVLETPRHNLALLVLNYTLEFTDTMHSVELPTKEQQPPFNDSWVAGWGAVTLDGVWTTSNRQLRVYRSMRLPNEDCKWITNQTKQEIVSSYMCFVQKYRRAPCTRDVGAPAVSDGILWGIASWSAREPCGTVRYPAIFEYVAASANLKWIMKMGKEMTQRALFAPVIKN